MGDKTKIEWTDASWTPIRARNKATGAVGWFCEHASEGCRNCYAEGMNNRLGTQLPFKPGHRKDVEIFVDEKILAQPKAWRRPRRIFVCSMTDLFGDFVPTDAIDQVFAMMAASPQHTFQVLTKRADRMRDYFHALRGMGEWNGAAWPLANVWLGVSVEDQAAADFRIPLLLQAPAAVHFLSCEPLLGPVNVARWLLDANYLEYCDAVGGPLPKMPASIGWVIAGGESGPHARPMHPAWARALRDQCAAIGTPFHFKQWGEWRHAPDRARFKEAIRERWTRLESGQAEVRPAFMVREGKKDAGRLLDGVEHNGFPATTLLERTDHVAD